MGKVYRAETFTKDGKDHHIQIQRTGNNNALQPARIILRYWYWDCTGGTEGWELYTVYDRIFEDWNYACAVYLEIVRRGKSEE